MLKILIEKDIMIPMRDGVKLATDMYRLEGESPAPVLIIRAPYNKETWLPVEISSTFCGQCRLAIRWSLRMCRDVIHLKGCSTCTCKNPPKVPSTPFGQSCVGLPRYSVNFGEYTRTPE